MIPIGFRAWTIQGDSQLKEPQYQVIQEARTKYAHDPVHQSLNVSTMARKDLYSRYFPIQITTTISPGFAQVTSCTESQFTAELLYQRMAEAIAAFRKNNA